MISEKEMSIVKKSFNNQTPLITENDFTLIRKVFSNGDVIESKIIHKADEQQIVYGVVLEPMTTVTPNGDAHGDVMTSEEIEKTAHNYMKTFRQIKKQHKGDAVKAYPVESFIAPVDFELGEQKIKKGSWILAVKIDDSDLWSEVKKGEINAFSPGGAGYRHPFKKQS